VGLGVSVLDETITKPSIGSSVSHHEQIVEPAEIASKYWDEVTSPERTTKLVAKQRRSELHEITSDIQAANETEVEVETTASTLLCEVKVDANRERAAT
jgi:hypothetical protein